MTELSPDARALIEQARKQGPGLLGPSAADRARLREKLAPTWGQAPAPRRSSSPSRWKRYALSSAALIAGIGWLCWLLFWPTAPATETNERADSPPPAAARAESPPTAAEEAAATQPSAAIRDGAEAPDGPDQAGTVTQAAHLPLKKPQSQSARERPRASTQPQSLAAQTDARAQLGLPAPGGSSRLAGASQTGDTSQRRMGSSRGSSAPPQAAAQAQPDASQAARAETQPADEAALLTAAAADSSTRAVRTDSRPAPRSIDGELELLGDAQSALQLQRPSRALTLLQEHAFRFPAGALVEERMAMQALALCALDRKHAASSVLSSLAARGSRSALLPRVRRQCGL